MGVASFGQAVSPASAPAKSEDPPEAREKGAGI